LGENLETNFIFIIFVRYFMLCVLYSMTRVSLYKTLNIRLKQRTKLTI